MSDGKKPARRRLSHEARSVFVALIAGLPALLVALYFLWFQGFTPKVEWTFSILIVLVWWACSYSLRDRIASPLQTISNLLAALREGDYSIRARGATYDNALGAVMMEVNSLGTTLREQRLGALEATALLRTVMTEIDVAVFAFDQEERLRLVNRSGERLLDQPVERLLGKDALELGLGECLDGEPVRTLEMTFLGRSGRWEVHRSAFREEGRPHQLVVLSDLSRALREEERQTWQRLIRVIGHELNNSLTPIKSIAGSLNNLVKRDPLPGDWRKDAQRGLSVIETRAEALNRFMEAYARLARLPKPTLKPLEVCPIIRRLVGLETRLNIRLTEGPNLTVQADGDQLEQLLINLLRNAVDAAMETRGGVFVSWKKRGRQLEVSIEDEGPGLSNTANLFVPFFTTKPGGSGIGLVLSRQIAEGHGGSLSLQNRKPGPGCIARLILPLNGQAS
ncbi:MAG: ATP-binding protein [Acidobacteriia bacterium]|nr:ATP-binding protein [Terriglobia bacterium]